MSFVGEIMEDMAGIAVRIVAAIVSVIGIILSIVFVCVGATEGTVQGTFFDIGIILSISGLSLLVLSIGKVRIIAHLVLALICFILFMIYFNMGSTVADIITFIVTEVILFIVYIVSFVMASFFG